MDKILDDTFEELDGAKWLKCQDRTPDSKSCVECFRLQYFNGNHISYDCIEKRKLYVLRFFPVHSAENREGLQQISKLALNNILKYAPIRILSIGGGPGSDIYATIKFLRDHIGDVTLHKIFITRIDIQPLWDGIANDTIRLAAGDFPLRIDTLHSDVMHGLETLKNEDDEFDIVLCSYLISELAPSDLRAMGKIIRSVTWNGGVIIVNDRPENNVEERIRVLFEGAGVNPVKIINNGWGKYIYNSKIANALSPKLNMNSKVFVGVKNDH